MDAPTSQAADPVKRTSRLATYASLAKQALPFVASWLLLDFLVNLRYPAPEPALWYLLPSIDVMVLFGYLALFGWNGWRVPTAVRVLLVALVIFVRFIRFGDGIQRKIYYQQFNLYTDLHLVPELVRFSYHTLPAWKFWAEMMAVLGAIALTAFLTYRALQTAERYLADQQNLYRAGTAGAIVFLLVFFFRSDPYWEDFYYGGFTASVVPRLKHEARFLLNVYGYSEEKSRLIDVVQEKLGRTPSNLAKLHHADVHLILVESYGQAVFDQPMLEEHSRATFDSFESELTGRGFNIATGVLSSPTYGGQSWLAHATLDTGVHTADQLQYDLVCARAKKVIARFFRDAGYRTVLVHPGTQRAWPKGEFYQFNEKYYAWNFGYAGPDYAWATMPDQFVLDFFRRTELEKRNQPLFDQIVLVSSHAPWSHLPVVVDDWSKIQNGDIYNHLETIRFPITWPDFADAQEAYIRSIIYDFDVLRRYISDYIKDDSLIIMLGDHQPVGEISGEGEHRGVPIHVLSRNPALVEPFLARGYQRGVRPKIVDTPPPMADFLGNLLEDFSTPGTEAP